MKPILYSFLLLCSLAVQAQESDLFDVFDENTQSEVVYATFKGTQLINASTNETPGEGVLQFMMAHRFGSFNDDYLYNFFGLDNAQVRMQLDYGVTDRLNIGIGRSSFLKVADGFIKYQLLQQQKGTKTFPVSITLHSSTNYRSARYTDGIDHAVSDRLSYMHQAIIAKKWNRKLSTLVSPSVVHFNLVPAAQDPNTTAHITLGARYKISNRMALTGESTLLSNREFSSGERYTTPFALGVDIETGGHVFQLHISNTRAMNGPYWMARNPYNASEGGLFLGFNISRVFTVKE
jgi:hypothetical protein